jgi:methionine-rich copper-binding protein CopC
MNSMPKRSRPVLRWLVATLLLMVAAAGVSRAAVHLALVKSEPANAAKLDKAPKAITLWFSQRPNVKLTKLVLSHSRDTMKTGVPVAVDTAGKEIRVAVDAPLSPGKYDVSWRTLARDGHAVSGNFTFTLNKSGVISGSSSTAPAPTPR